MPAADAAPTLDFAALFDAAPEPQMVVDRELRFVAANRAYLRITSSRLEDLLGRRVLEVFPDDPDDPDGEPARMLRGSLERVLASGASDELALIPYRVARVPGGPLEPRFWSATHTPLLDADGAVAFILQHTVDVTDLHRPTAPPTDAGDARRRESGVFDRAERVQASVTCLDGQLRDLRRMFAQAPGFMCFLRGPDHVFEIVNAAYQQLVGERSLIGRPLREALPEVDRQGFVAQLDRVFATGEPWVGRGVPVTLDRGPGRAPDQAVVDFVYQPIRDADGAIRGILVQGSDITAATRLAAERDDLLLRERVARGDAEMAAEEQRFFAESIPVQVWTATPAGALDFVNGRVAEYVGASREAVLGAGWTQVIHPDDLAHCLERWDRSISTGEPYAVEFRLRRADGDYRWHVGRAVALRDAAGAIVRWFGYNTDVDDDRRALAEIQARAAYEQRLIGIVSHDLRNPLSSIGLAAGLLLERGGLDPAAHKIVLRISSSAERASRLISDLLGFARSRMGARIPIDPRPSNLRAIVAQIVDEVQVVDPAREVRIAHRGEETGRWDPDRISQVISNLVGNAFQHGPPGHPIVVESAIEGDQVELAVSNRGAPIPPADLPHLFEPFVRGQGARATRGPSVGLGLFIAREVARAHGGSLEVSSDAQSGTRFTVRLPRFAEVEVAAPNN